jgi:hypothetical protein
MLGRLPNLSGFKIADRYLLWPVPKLKIDLSRRNASTQGRKTDLVERYQHYAIAFFVQQLYYSFFSMKKGYITTNILKKYSDVAEKNILILVEEKKII